MNRRRLLGSTRMALRRAKKLSSFLDKDRRGAFRAALSELDALLAMVDAAMEPVVEPTQVIAEVVVVKEIKAK